MRSWLLRLLSASVIVLLNACAIFGATATPSLMSYQGQLADASGNPLTGIYNIVFTIYDDAALGGPSHIIWQEAQNGTNVRNGLFSVMLGNGTPAVPLIADVFATPERWLGIKIGADPEIVPRSRLQSVAYSQKVSTIDKARGGIISGHVTIAQATKEGEPKESGSLTILGDAGDTIFMVSPPSSSRFAGALSISGTLALTNSADSVVAMVSSTTSGYGKHYGMRGKCESATGGLDTSRAYGVNGIAVSTGLMSEAIGGRFDASGDYYSVGTEIESTCPSGSAAGLSVRASGNNAWGADFQSSSSTSSSTGVWAAAYINGGSSPDECTGVDGWANSVGTGPCYGGDFGSAGSGTTYGVRGSATAYGASPAYAGYFKTEIGGTGSKYALYALASSGGSGMKTGIYASAPNTPAGSYAGYFAGKVRITDSLIVMGGKSAAVKDDQGDYRLLYCQESPEVWFEDVGRGQLADGRAHIDLDPLFLQTVTINEKHPIEVFIQLRGNCNGTFVVTSSSGFDVTELQNGKSNAPFSYRVMAKRKGFENIRLPKMGGPTPEEFEAEQEKNRADMEKVRQEDAERQFQRRVR